MHVGLIERLGLSAGTDKGLKATKLKVQEMCKCANEMELSAALNAICADVPCEGKPSVREHCSTDRIYSCTVIDSTQVCMVTHLSTGSIITNENTTKIT